MAEDTKQPAERGVDGRFLPGNTGGPGKRRMTEDVREMLLAATPKAAQRLVEALDAETVVHHQGIEVGTYTDHGMRIKAAQTILERLYGKPNQPVTGEDGKPLAIDLAPLLERLAGE